MGVDAPFHWREYSGEALNKPVKQRTGIFGSFLLTLSGLGC